MASTEPCVSALTTTLSTLAWVASSVANRVSNVTLARASVEMLRASWARCFSQIARGFFVLQNAEFQTGLRDAVQSENLSPPPKGRLLSGAFLLR